MSWWLPRNPVAYAWFHARGGMGWHAAVISLASLGGSSLLWLSVLNGSTGVASAWSVAMLMLLGGLTVLVGGLGVSGAVRADAGSGDGAGTTFGVRSAWSSTVAGLASGGKTTAASASATDAHLGVAGSAETARQGELRDLAPGDLPAGADHEMLVMTSGVGGGMHDSLRQMLVSPAQLIWGYVLGGSSYAVCAAVPCGVVGVLACVLAGTSVQDFLTGAGLLLVTALCTWVGTVLLALVTRQSGVILVVLVLLAPLLLWAVAVVPGLSLVLTPLSGSSVFDLRVSSLSAPLLLGVATQLTLAGLCFVAARRRFEQPYRQVFGVDLGLMLVAVCGIANTLGLVLWPSVGPSWLVNIEPYDGRLVAGSLALWLVVGAVPVTAAAAQSGVTLFLRRRLRRNPPVRFMRRKLAVLLGATVACGLLPAAIRVILPGAGFEWSGFVVPLTAAAVAMTLHALYLLELGTLCHALRPGRSRLWVGAGLIGVLVLPPMAELLARAVLLGGESFGSLGPVGWVSPLTVVWSVYTQPQVPMTSLVGGQAGLAVLVLVLRFVRALWVGRATA